MLRSAVFVAVLAAMPAISSAQQPCTTDAKHVVDKLTSGSTVREVVHAIADSPEHNQRFYNANEGAVANERAVANLYRHILGRQPDAGGLRTYTNMAATRGLHEVAHAILNSDEYNRTFGEWGVPGSGGVVYCGNGTASTQSSVTGTTGTANTQMLYADLDRNHDGVIARSEWRGSPNSFRMRDWNGDGVLSGMRSAPTRYRRPTRRSTATTA